MKTQEELNRIASAADARMSEFFDGHVVVGFVGDQPVLVRNFPDRKTNMALQQLLMMALASADLSAPGSQTADLPE